MSEVHYDVIVVGGGIVGVSTAYHLVCAGANTLLIDRVDWGRATSAGAGILAPELERGRSETWFNFAVEAVAYYPSLVKQLQSENAGNTGYHQCGMLLVAATEDEIEPYRQAESHILDRQRRRGTPSETDLHPVTPDEARILFPALAHIHAALYYRGAARVDGGLMAWAFQRAAKVRGLAYREANVQELCIEQGRVVGVKTAKESYFTSSVVIAGGAWSKQFGRQLGVQIPVEPQRGQIAHLDLPQTETGSWPIVSAFHGHYIVCWPGMGGVGRVVVGATREVNSGYAPHTSVEGIHEVMGEALRVAPGLASARLHEIRVGLRPYCKDGLPILSRVPGANNVILATGHGPTGLQLGPYSGKVAAELALSQHPSIDISGLDIQRFLRR